MVTVCLCGEKSGSIEEEISYKNFNGWLEYEFVCKNCKEKLNSELEYILYEYEQIYIHILKEHIFTEESGKEIYIPMDIVKLISYYVMEIPYEIPYGHSVYDPTSNYDNLTIIYDTPCYPHRWYQNSYRFDLYKLEKFVNIYQLSLEDKTNEDKKIKLKDQKKKRIKNIKRRKRRNARKKK